MAVPPAEDVALDTPDTVADEDDVPAEEVPAVTTVEVVVEEELVPELPPACEVAVAVEEPP